MRKIKSIISIILISAIFLCLSSFAHADNAAMRYADGVMTISGLDGTASLIHASYDNGTLKNAEITDVTNGTRNIAAENGDKFFLWQSVGAMIPLCGTITVGKNTESKPIPTPAPTPTPTSVPTPTPEPETGKTLVVYYSATGTTERVANYIANAANADIFELEPVNEYSNADLDWTDETSRVNDEHNDESKRNIELKATTVPNWESYDTVFIGYPIWWHSASWVVYNFVKYNDFTGKTVIPFSTSASSGEVGDTAIKNMTQTGTWLAGRGFYSSASENTVKDWVDGLGI